MRTFSPTQKRVAGGAMLLALGLASGLALAPESSGELATLDVTVAVPSGRQVDPAAYHRAMAAARAACTCTDLMTGDVKPGSAVATHVNVALGARPGVLDLVGPAVDRFTTVSVGYEDLPGRDLPGAGVQPGRTRITVVVRNDSAEPAPFVALLHLATGTP